MACVGFKATARVVVSNPDWKEKNAQFGDAHFEGGRPLNWNGAARNASISPFVPRCSRCASSPASFQLWGTWVLRSLTLPPAHPNAANLPITITSCQWIQPLSFQAALLQWNLLSNTESVRKIFLRPSASNPTFQLQSLNLQIEARTCYAHSVRCENRVHIYVLYKDSNI